MNHNYLNYLAKLILFSALEEGLFLIAILNYETE